MTWCCWVKLATDRNTYQVALGNDDTSANYHQIGTSVTGSTFVRASSSGDSGPGYDFVIGTWTFIASVYSAASTDAVYYAPAGTSTLVVNSPAGGGAGLVATNTFYIASNGFANWWDGSIAAVKVWIAALTKTELETELSKYSPVRTANLWANYTFRNGPQTADESGNARTLTQGGTPTLDAAGPPIT